MKKWSVTVLLFWGVNTLFASVNSEVEKYINEWKDVAVQQMQDHAIPASITIAQGILESAHGTSRLAVKGNNHFGIKCHGWKGAKIYHDDDKKGECFRKYKNARESFRDHSEFLTGRSRYQSLFTLTVTDYKGWAHGLKEAGYATNPKYAYLLIDLIEKYNLSALDTYTYDQPEQLTVRAAEIDLNASSDVPESIYAKERKKRTIITNPNRSRYVVVKEGDTFYRIAQEFELTLRQLHRYNDFPKHKDVLEPGDIVYITPKRNRSSRKMKKIKLNEDKNLRDVSQEHGVKLKALMLINNITSADEALKQGEVVYLR